MRPTVLKWLVWGLALQDGAGSLVNPLHPAHPAGHLRPLRPPGHPSRVDPAGRFLCALCSDVPLDARCKRCADEAMTTDQAICWQERSQKDCCAGARPMAL